MGKLLEKRWLGDQLVAVVGLLVAAAMAALLGGVNLVSNRVDQSTAAREVEMAQTAIYALKDKIKNDLIGFTPPDSTFEAPNAVFSRWLHRHFGARLFKAGRYDRAYVFDVLERPVYAAHNGMLAANPSVFDIDEKVLDAAKTVRSMFNGVGVIERLIAMDTREAAPPPTSIYRAQFVRVDGRAAIVAAVAMAPIFARKSAQYESPPVVSVVAFFDEHLAREISSELGLRNMRISNSAKHDSHENGIKIEMEGDDAPVWMHWAAAQPGTAILNGIAPALGIITLLFGIVTLIVMRTMRKSTLELAVSERRAVELAYRDPLTGLANRLKLVESLNEQLPALKPGQKLALFFLDLDGFKDINDTLGHPVGDELLAMVGERLEGILGSKGLTVRFGGDEFALLAPVASASEIAKIAERINETVRQPTAAGEHMLQVGVTIGVALAPEHGTEPEELLRRADIALYKGKGEGRGAYRVFEQSDETVLQNRRAIERDIDRALWHDEFFPLFQPVFSANGERLEAVETLVRWQHPERGMVPPADFIHVAEKCGLIVRLDEWVLRKACEHGLAWPDISVAVNMSPSNFRQANLAERVKRVIEDTGFDPRRLEIEITEGMLLNANEEVLFDLQELREYGIRIAIDDFGTGYSSLGYLGSFPVDKIKIDKSFVQNLGVKEDAAAIVECVARLGRALGLAVTAEGVETAAQHRFVRAAGCQQIQGFLFSKPLRPAEVSAIAVKSQPDQKRA